MSRKRKHAVTAQDKHTIQQHEEKQIDPALFVQAYEADIIQGPQSKVYAESLEFRKDSQSGAVQHIGSSLLKWDFINKTRTFRAEDEPDKPNSDHEIWVDRYDARLLLDSLPEISTLSRSVSPLLGSESGWSDLPSDSEYTFFLSKEDTEDYRRQKRRKIFEQNREERLKALQDIAEDDTAQTQVADLDTWGGSDEEPDEQVKEIMRRTARNLQSASNPTQLEMRILANFGADKRFAFLRGRWSKSWASTKAELNSEDAKAKKLALGALADYSDSDDDST